VEKAIALASTPLERARSCEQRGMIARTNYQGDLSWASLREAADIRLRDVADDEAAIARVCARAVENPMRWPGSMMTIPDEEVVRRYIDHGLAAAREGSVEWIRLVTASAFTLFAFAPIRGSTPEEVDACLRAGLAAADAALAIGRPDLASAALDGAGSSLIAIGNYGRAVPILERRLELAEGFDDPWEIGDVNDMVTWNSVMIGDFERGRDFGNRAFDLIELGAEGLATHGLSWCAIAELELGTGTGSSTSSGRRSSVSSPHRRASAVLRGEYDRRAGVIETLQGDERAACTSGLRRMPGRRREIGRGASGRGLRALAEPARSTRPGNSSPGPTRAASWATCRCCGRSKRSTSRSPGSGTGRRRSPSRRGRTRLRPGSEPSPSMSIASTGGPPSPPAEHQRAVALLERASDGFASLSARWEEARTNTFLAEALAHAGRAEEARAPLRSAAEVFERLGARWELERAHALEERLG
jgi:tetratricopeptide (TPR) repeat protein